MQIVRVEHKIDGRGIFRSRTKGGNCRYERIPKHKNLTIRHVSHFPPPHRDKGIMRSPYSYEFCAFKSIDELQRWVTKEEISNLIKKGFKVLVHDVSDCTIGEYQVLFDKDDIRDTTDVSELFI